MSIMLFNNLLNYSKLCVNYRFIIILFVFPLIGFSQNHPYPKLPENATSINNLNPTLTWLGSERFVRYTVTLYNCNYKKGTNFESLRLNNYAFVTAIQGEYAYETSNLTINESRPNCITTVDDNGQKILSFKDNFTSPTEQNINLEGFDYEGLTYLYEDYFLMVEEQNDQIFFLNFKYENGSDLTGVEHIRTYNFFNNFITGSNQGWEGITYNPAKNRIYLVKETNPPSIYEGVCTKAPYFTGTIQLTEPFKLQNTSWRPDNVSSLYHLSLNKELSATKTGEHLLIIAKATNTIFEFDLEGNLVSQLNINTNQLAPFNEGFFKPEGVAYSNGKLYLSSDSDWTKNAMFYVYENRQHQNPVAENKKLVFQSPSLYTNQLSVPAGVLQNNTEYCWQVTGYDNAGKAYISSDYSFTAELPCYNFLTHLQNSNIDASQYYSDNYIRSYKTVEKDDTLAYYAKEFVDLANGFEVKKGASFTAGIGACE